MEGLHAIPAILRLQTPMPFLGRNAASQEPLAEAHMT